MKSRQVALVIRCQINSSGIRRFKKLSEALGPVIARSYRQASRIANTLRAGYPVHDYEELAPARLILVCAPDAELDGIVSELAQARLRWARKIVVVCGNGQESERLRELAKLGAATCSLSTVAGADEHRSLMEGDPRAVRETKRLVEASGGRAIEIRSSTQRLCSAATAFASWLMLPAVDAAMRCLRLAGFTPGKAAPIIEDCVGRALRAYLKAGRRSWKTPSSAADKRAFLNQVEAVCARDPALAGLLLESARTSLRRTGRKADWVESAPPAPRRAAAGR